MVGRWDHPHPLVPDRREVAALLTARVSQLRSRSRWRVTDLPDRGVAWAWSLDGDHLLWGATAVATASLLELLDPDWRGGVTPDQLGPDHHVTPWEWSAAEEGGAA